MLSCRMCVCAEIHGYGTDARLRQHNARAAKDLPELEENIKQTRAF